MKSKENLFKQETIIIQPTVSRQQKLLNILKRVEDKVVTLIDSEAVKIPTQQIPFAEARVDHAKQISAKLRSVQQARAKMRSRLQSINEEQQKLKQQRKTVLAQTRQKSLSPLSIKTKSQLSSDDIQLLKRLKHQQKQFQNSLGAKTEEYNKKVEELKKEEEMLHQKHMKEQVEVRKKEIAQRLQFLQRQRFQRQKQFQEEKRRMAEVKAKKKLFQEMQAKQKELQKLQMQKKINLMQSRLKMQQVDFQSLKQHQENYHQMKAHKEEERKRKKQQLSELQKQRQSLPYQKSKFHTLVVNESKKKKEEQLQQRQQRLLMIEAARDYAQSVKKYYAPRLKTHSSSTEKAKEKIQSRTFEEIKQIGKNYLQQMKGKIKIKKVKNKQTSLSVSNNDSKITPGSEKTFLTKYRDYLSQKREFRQKQGQDKMNRSGDAKIKNKFIRRQLEEVCKKAADLDKNEGFQKLRAFAFKLEAERGKQDHLLLDKIAAKLHILQSLSKH